MKSFLLFFMLVSFCISNAQDRFTFTPQFPKPGEEISITYTPGGDLAGLAKIPEAYVLESSANGNNVTNIQLVRNAGKLMGKFVTDTATRFVAFGFTNDGKYDTNNDNGFIILLHNGNQPCKNANVYACNFYNTLGKSRFGILRNKERALQYLDEEMKLYPKNKKDIYLKYVTLQYQTSPTTGKAIVQKEIENAAASLRQKEDYTNLSGLYKLLEFENQSKFVTSIRDEKFPVSKPSQTDILLQNAMKISDFSQQEVTLDRLLQEVQKAGNASKYEGTFNSIRQSIARAYLGQKDDAGFKKIANTITDNSVKYRLYQNAAILFMNDNKFPLALSFAKDAMDWSKNEVKHPTEKKPPMSIHSEWETSRINEYAGYINTYAMVLEKAGKYKEGFKYAKEAVMLRPSLYNYNYILLAQKVLSPKQAKELAEGFIKRGEASNRTVDLLKEIYVKKLKSAEGFDHYLSKLKNEAGENEMIDLKSKMLNIPAPGFTLTDLNGKRVSLSDYKDKIVILDFWATWCGPCKASFPAMQKLVDKYKDNPDVKFLFIDTWERAEDKLTPAADYISSMKYNFRVLMDNEDKVVSSYKVESIPAKFIIGKDGNIKFKDTGFHTEASTINMFTKLITIVSEE